MSDSKKPSRAEISIDYTMECSLCNKTLSGSRKMEIHLEFCGYEVMPSGWSTICKPGHVPFALCHVCSSRFWDAIERGETL